MAQPVSDISSLWAYESYITIISTDIPALRASIVDGQIVEYASKHRGLTSRLRLDLTTSKCPEG